MAGHNYYILAALPPVGELGSAPPVSTAELLERVEAIPPLRAILQALFLSHDLLLREAVLAGELEELDDLAVLTPGQARNEAPLPAVCAGGDEGGRPIAADELWETYFAYAAAVARRWHCSFLAAWVGHEVALRNALAIERAQALDLDPADYVVARHLAKCEEDVGAVVNDWAASATPLAALRVLDRARWAWLKAHDGWFTFRDDEVAAYGAKVMLLGRWQRLAQAETEGVAAGSAERKA